MTEKTPPNDGADEGEPVDPSMRDAVRYAQFVRSTLQPFASRALMKFGQGSAAAAAEAARQ